MVLIPSLSKISCAHCIRVCDIFSFCLKIVSISVTNKNFMQIDPTIFKAYDVRGIYPTQVSEEFVYAFGRAYATFMSQESLGVSHVIGVGADGRISSPSLKAKLIQGLLDSGFSVVDVGLVSTPSFYYAIAKLGLQGGIQVSASHNPKQYNGLKVVRAGSVPVSNETGLESIKEIIKNEAYVPIANKKGVVFERSGLLEEQVVDMSVGFDVGQIKNFKVVVDGANSVGVLDIEALFKILPCRLIPLNFEIDGNFPAHEADPLKEENLAQIKAKVLEEKADIGFAPDGDGDRLFVIDEKGEVVPPAILRGLLAQIELQKHPGGLVAYDIRPGRITKDMIEAAGGKFTITRVGHSLIKEQMLKEGAIFGGESSGHFYYKLPIGVFEAPMLVVLEVLQYLSRQDKTLSEIIAPYKKYFHSGEINVPLPPGKQVKQVLEAIEHKYANARYLYIDGLSVEYPDVWFNIRSSNTEPVMRVTVEAKSRERMEEVKENLLHIISE